ncbi:hypothetical protein [Pseudomonas aeruginosa]|uniref:hypothetical protein n=1 Tax=Pseudomonas aeruginosa TaxID=287 RepID=UPI002358F475|nr:hypothetical protein [Pseudomonas aeruginosa]
MRATGPTEGAEGQARTLDGIRLGAGGLARRRDHTYSTRDGSPLVLQGLEPLPEGYTLQQPGPNQVWKDGAWVDDLPGLLAAAHKRKTLEIRAAGQAFLDGGFYSSALGNPHFYASSLSDQMNVTSLAALGISADYPCAAGGEQNREWRRHTANQLRQVGVDLVQHRQAGQQQVERLQDELDAALAAQDLERLEAITWSIPA